MTHLKQAVVRSIFKEHYKELGALRWFMKNSSYYKVAFSLTGVAVNIIALMDRFAPLIIWVAVITAATTFIVIDAAFIYSRLKKIKAACSKHEIEISLYTLKEICKHELPQ